MLLLEAAFSSILMHKNFSLAESTGRAVWDVSLRPLSWRDCGFEYRQVVCCHRSLWRADPSSRVVLPSVFHWVWSGTTLLHVQYIGREKSRLRKEEIKKERNKERTKEIKRKKENLILLWKWTVGISKDFAAILRSLIVFLSVELPPEGLKEVGAWRVWPNLIQCWT